MRLRAPVLGFFAIVSCLWAATARGQPAPMTLSAAVTRAEQRAPDVVLAAARLQIARADVGVAGVWENPRITVGTNWHSARFYTALALPLPIFGQVGARTDAAEALVTAARRDREVARLDVRLGVSLAWVDLWLAEREAESAGEADERAARLSDVARERFEAGAAPRLDALRARAEAARAHAGAVAAQRTVSGVAARLGVWLGDPEVQASRLRTRGAPPAPTRLPPLSTFLARVGAHPLVRAARSRSRAAEIDIAASQRARWPAVEVEVGIEALGHSQPTEDAHAQLTVAVPVLDFGGAAIDRSRAGLIEAHVQADTVRRRLATDLVAAHADLEAATVRAGALDRDVLPAVQEAAALAVDAYREGRLDVQGVIAAEQALAETRLEAQRAAAERARAWALLQHASGGER